jgi:hypothetical protein
MAPARLVGRYRPALQATNAADALAFQALPKALVALGLPLAVIALGAFVSVLHATTVIDNVAPHVNWLRFQMDDVWTEAPAFILLAIAIGVFSPALGVFLVATFGIMDLAASVVQPYELQPLPGALAGRLVAIWLLWLLVVEIPVFGRLLARSMRGVAGNRPAMAALNGAITGVFTLFWAAGAAILLRPIFEWSTLPSGGRAEAYIPMQTGGVVFAIAAAGIAAAVAFSRGPGALMSVGSTSAEPTGSAPKPAPVVVMVAQRLLFSALLTIGLGGMITAPLDAVVLFATLAGAAPLARLIGARLPVGALFNRLPSIARVGLSIPLVYGVSFLLIDAGLLKSISEFFPVIAVFAVGLFVIELITAEGAGSSVVRPSLAGAAGPAALTVTLLAVAAVAPLPVLADNGGSLVDMWPTIDIAVFAGMATPFIFWMAKRFPPPPPPPQGPPPPPDMGPPSPEEQKARDRMKDVLKRARDQLRERKKMLNGGPPATVGSVTGRKG